MNILFVSHDRCLGGAISSLLNIIFTINRDYPNIKVFVVVPKGKVFYSDELDRLDCTVLHEKYYLWGGWNPSGSFVKLIYKKLKWFFHDRIVNMITAQKLAEYAKENNIDIIHSNSSIVNLGALISKYSKIKHIWHFREFLQEDQNVIMWCSNSFFRKTIKNHCDIIIAISKAIENKYKNLFGNKIKMIYNGVPEPDKTDILKKNENDQIFNIIEVGKITKNKGVDISIRALKELVERGYKNVMLYLAGKPEFDFDKSEYEAVKDYVNVLGQMKPKQITELRRSKAQIEVVCSKSEAFGRVTIEAMMCGLPVIGSASGGTPELIKDGYNGYLFKPGDASDLADKIEYLINNREVIQTMSSNGEIFAKNFTIEQCVSNIVNLYNEIL